MAKILFDKGILHIQDEAAVSLISGMYGWNEMVSRVYLEQSTSVSLIADVAPSNHFTYYDEFGKLHTINKSGDVKFHNQPITLVYGSFKPVE